MIQYLRWSTLLMFLYSPYLTESARIKNETASYRLPQDLFPEYYRIEIITNLADLNDNFTFEGRVWIKVHCKKETNKIVLHNKNLEVDEDKVYITLNDPIEEDEDEEETTCHTLRSYSELENCLDGAESNKSEIEIKKHDYKSDEEFYIIETEDTLTPGKVYSIYIPYRGVLTEGLAGYYRSSYTDIRTGENKWLAVTQFESTDARMAFPCFDEPSFKAKFQVNLGHTKYRNAISNMPITVTEPIKGMKGWVWDRFQVSVPMSTYILAFMVSDFSYKESVKSRRNNVDFRIWARKDALDQVDFASDIGPKVLEYYEDYFDVKYPLPKQDMVAIPDFSAGAMENWGLVTFRETALLFDPNISSFFSKPYVAYVIAHELAHQWFGNLVTMKWWTDLWLNEGFATYVATVGVNHVQPEWESLDTTSAENMLNVFSLDALISSHPISAKIGHPKEISQIFDKISYDKGSLILRMMNHYLGEEAFRTGVSSYLKKHKYGNAEQDDLWDALTNSAHSTKTLSKCMDVKEIMDTWTIQTGYPLITVTRDYNSGTAVISQERYLADTSKETRDEENSCWWIPLSYTCEREAEFNRTMPKKWMKCNEDETIINNLPNDQWVIFNIQMTGIYRVQYDKKNWGLLTRTLLSPEFKKIHVLNRVQLIADITDLAEIGVTEYKNVFQLLSYLKQETEYDPWNIGLSQLNYIDHMMEHTPDYALFRKYMKKLLTPIYNKIGEIEYERTNKNLKKLKLQNMIIGRACYYDVGGCRERAKELFDEWMSQDDPDTNNPINNEIRKYVYCTAIKFGGEEEWSFAWERYRKSNVGSEKSTILAVLACTREVWILSRYLEWSLDSSSGIRKQDSASVFRYVLNNPAGYYLAKNYFFDKIKDIYKYHGSRTATLGKYAKGLATAMTTQREIIEMTDFSTKNCDYFHGSDQALKQGIERAKINVIWKNKFYPEIIKILKVL